jgi:hypothetical protein
MSNDIMNHSRRGCVGGGISLLAASAFTAKGAPASKPINRDRPTWDLKQKFGCKGDGSDEQGRLADAFTQAAAANSDLFAPAGIYAHSGTLTLNGVQLSGVGQSSEFRALNPKSGAIYIRGALGGLAALSVTSPNAKERQSNYDCCGVVFVQASQFKATNITVVGAEAAGILLHDSSNGFVSNTSVSKTLADSLHMTCGTRNITVVNPVATDCGDDSVAVVSYIKQGKICQDITVHGGRSYRSGARGYTVVGGRRVHFISPYIEASQCAAIYFASESSYDTYGCQDCWATAATANGCVTRPNLRHGALMVYGRTGTAQAGSETLSLLAQDCGFIRPVVKGAGAGIRAAIALDPGSIRGVCASGHFSDLRGGGINAIDIGGADAVVKNNYAENIGGALINLNINASGTIIDENNSGRNLCQDVWRKCARNYQDAKGVTLLDIRGGHDDVPASVRPLCLALDKAHYSIVGYH